MTLDLQRNIHIGEAYSQYITHRTKAHPEGCREVTRGKFERQTQELEGSQRPFSASRIGRQTLTSEIDSEV